MKIVFWNIENAVSRLATLASALEYLGSPDVLCLQELRIREADLPMVEALGTALPGYHAHVSLPRDARNVTFRGGRIYGVATFVRGRWKAEAPSFDREGRIVVVKKRGLAIVNVYAVNGTAKPYYDEAGRVAGDRHELKRRFQAQVMDLGERLREEGSVVMGGDWNVSRTRLDTYPRLRTEEPHALARAQFNERLAAAGFIDIWRERHPKERGYTWYNRRARGLDAARVDYILVSEDLAPRIRSAEILERHPWSDHAPVSIDW
jgi:exodeoxyribonuclease III